MPTGAVVRAIAVSAVHTASRPRARPACGSYTSTSEKYLRVSEVSAPWRVVRADVVDLVDADQPVRASRNTADGLDDVGHVIAPDGHRTRRLLPVQEARLLQHQNWQFTLVNMLSPPSGDTNLRAEPEPPLDPVLSLLVNRVPPSDT
jgi:hypothetical protein